MWPASPSAREPSGLSVLPQVRAVPLTRLHRCPCLRGPCLVAPEVAAARCWVWPAKARRRICRSLGCSVVLMLPVLGGDRGGAPGSLGSLGTAVSLFGARRPVRAQPLPSICHRLMPLLAFSLLQAGACRGCRPPSPLCPLFPWGGLSPVQTVSAAACPRGGTELRGAQDEGETGPFGPCPFFPPSLCATPGGTVGPVC